MPTRQKNVLIIHCDQLRADCLGFAGNSYVRTPNIDELAKEGTVLTQHIASSTICSPSRASLLTGLYQPGHGLWTNGVPLNRKEYFEPMKKPAFSQWDGMPLVCADEVPTMADVFKNAGYDTLALGKLHLTPNMASTKYGFQESYLMWADDRLDGWDGPYYGFDKVGLTCSHGEELAYYGHYGKWLEKTYPQIAKDARKNAISAKGVYSEFDDFYDSKIPNKVHNTTWLANQFDDYINQPRENPFFAFVGFPDPHHPFTPSPEIFEMFKDCDVHTPIDPEGLGVVESPALDVVQNVSKLPEEARKDVIRATYAMIYQIDLAVGKIIKTLKDKKLWDNTIIVFTSDHGDYLCDHGLLRKSQFASDTLLRIPCVIRNPGNLNNRILDYPTSNCDIMPTLTTMTGVKPPEKIHGSNIFNKTDEAQKSNNVFSYTFTGKIEDTSYTVYSQNCRFTYFPESNTGELFDHSKDKEEIYNLFNDIERKEQIENFKDLLKEQLFITTNPIISNLAHW